MNITETNVQVLPLRDLHENKGQIEGVPANPRILRDDKYKALLRSLQEDDLTGVQPLKVYNHNGQYVVLGGNMRLKALRELKRDASVSCLVVPQDTPTDILRKIVIIDNSTFGEWDFDMLANEWDAEELNEWGVSVPEFPVDDEDDTPKQEKNEYAEKLLDEAAVQNITEYLAQVKYTLKNGFLCTGLTRGLAKQKFLRALYYNEKYPQKMAFVYAPEIYCKSRGGEDYLSRLEKIANGETWGIAGFRTMCNDGALTHSIGSSYSVGGGGGGDFPSNIAREIYEKFAGNGRVLDPCHGWGGRLVGAMLAGVREYIGIDPSPIAARAVADIYADFGGYVETKAKLIAKPYEDVNDDELGGLFDCALTSPPYFDVELYEGEETSTTRYNNFDLWCERFYEPLIVNTMQRLIPGGSFFLQVGSQTYPLAKRAHEICEKRGLKCSLYADDISFSTLGTEDRTDKEVVLQITAEE